MTCRLILNADDFGWTEGVNAAVERLHRQGIVTSASLMIAAPAARDAVARARAMPGLAVGLHLALVGAPAALAAREIPRLSDRKGWLRSHCLAVGLACTLLPAWRREMRREMEEQFRRFDAAGLGWSHVDFHLHFGLTPVVFEEALRLARERSVSGIRCAPDDGRLHGRLDPVSALRDWPTAAFFSLFCAGRRERALRSGLSAPARCLGILRSGRLDRDYLARLIRGLPDGDFELHCHPDLGTERGRRECAALESEEFRSALAERGVRLCTYADLGDRVPTGAG